MACGKTILHILIEYDKSTSILKVISVLILKINVKK